MSDAQHDLRGVVSDEAAARLAERNRQRTADAIDRLGDRYVLRHRVERKPAPRILGRRAT